jgi:hypothetical protein
MIWIFIGYFSSVFDTINTHKLKQPIGTQHKIDVNTNVIGVIIKTTVSIQLIVIEYIFTQSTIFYNKITKYKYDTYL